MKGKALAIVLFVALAALLISCAQTTPSPSATTAAPKPPVSTTAAAPPPVATTAAPPPPVTTTAAPPPTSAKQYGGTLNIIMLAEIMNFDGTSNVKGPINADLQPPIWEALLRTKNLAGDNENVLCTDYTVAPDGKSLTFKVRQGIKFQDGTDLNAEAVKWHYDNFQFIRQMQMKNVASVEVLDTYTVRINLTKPDNSFMGTIKGPWGQINSPTAAKAELAAGGNVLKTGVVGTGPFKFVDWQRGSILKTAKWSGYWQQGMPYLDGLNYLSFANAQTAMMSFQAGEGQVISGLSPRNAATLKQKGYTIQYCPGMLYMIWPSSKNPTSPWSKLEVRQAVEYAIDKKKITDTYGYGFNEPQYETAVPAQPGSYDPSLKPRLYDPDKAKQLLAAAGYPNGFDTTLYCQTGDDPDMVTAVQGYLKAVGISAKIQPDTTSVFMDMGAKGWEGLRYYDFGIDDSNSLGAYGAFFWDAPVHTSAMLKPAEMEDAIAQAVSVVNDTAKMNKYLQTVTKIQSEQCLSIPLWNWPVTIAMDKTVHDLGLAAINFSATWSAAPIWLSK